MAYCIKCGAKVEDNMRFCPECGAEIPLMKKIENRERYESGSTGQTEIVNPYQDYRQADAHDTQQNREGYFDPEDVRANKGMGILSYFGFLVIIPLLARNKASEYAKFHVNKGLVLFITSVIINLLDGGWVFGLHSWINFGNTIFSWIFDLLGIVCFVFAIMGIVIACKGEKKELPIIGKIRILK